MKIKCQQFSRVSGFYTDANTWNPGKASEYKLRKYYLVPHKNALESAKNGNINKGSEEL